MNGVEDMTLCYLSLFLPLPLSCSLQREREGERERERERRGRESVQAGIIKGVGHCWKITSALRGDSRRRKTKERKKRETASKAHNNIVRRGDLSLSRPPSTLTSGVGRCEQCFLLLSPALSIHLQWTSWARADCEALLPSEESGAQRRGNNAPAHHLSAVIRSGILSSNFLFIYFFGIFFFFFFFQVRRPLPGSSPPRTPGGRNGRFAVVR